MVKRCAAIIALPCPLLTEKSAIGEMHTCLNTSRIVIKTFIPSMLSR